jgi:serine/threonine protein kinase
VKLSDELKYVYDQMAQGVRPEDLFGFISEDTDAFEEVTRIYRRFARVLHPDLYNDPEAKELAEEAFKKLNEFYEKAKEKIKAGVYGTPGTENRETGFVIKTRKREYNVVSTIARGDIAVIYGGNCVDGEDCFGKVAIKVAENPEDNDLIQNEVRVLEIFQSKPGPQHKHLPVLLDQFKTSDNQMGTILRHIDACDFFSIKEKFQNGVPAIHVAWIMERCLSVIGYSHKQGVVHGNIEPAHLMVNGQDHNVFLIDWCYAIINPWQTGEAFKVFNENYSAPEVKDLGIPTPAADLYSLGKCLIYLLGGDIERNTMPCAVDPRFQRFIQFFVRESALQRAQDAWEMHDKLKDLRKEIWGQPSFLEFKI